MTEEIAAAVIARFLVNANISKKLAKVKGKKGEEVMGMAIFVEPLSCPALCWKYWRAARLRILEFYLELIRDMVSRDR